MVEHAAPFFVMRGWKELRSTLVLPALVLECGPQSIAGRQGVECHNGIAADDRVAIGQHAAHG